MIHNVHTEGEIMKKFMSVLAAAIIGCSMLSPAAGAQSVYLSKSEVDLSVGESTDIDLVGSFNRSKWKVSDGNVFSYQNGKITAGQVKDICRAHWQDDNPEFAPQPKVVYISFPTEFGTLYTREELRALRRVCDENNLYLFMDGARLGYGLAAQNNDVTWQDIAICCDAFYIGGTKLGALLGEAVVLVNPKLQKDFRYLMKQRGAILAKGRLLGIQFLTLLENGLYEQLGAHANKLALQIRDACREAGLSFLYDSPTNQQFPILPNDLLKELEENYVFSHISALPNYKTAISICTSLATAQTDVEQLIADLKRLTEK